jgi:hypothetical protein
LEKQVDQALNGISGQISKSRVGAALRYLDDNSPSIESVELPTPFGPNITPHLTLPELSPPSLDGRQRRAVKAAVAMDLAALVAIVPVVGDIIGNAIQDTYRLQLLKLLDPSELPGFNERNKVSPSTTVALLQAMVRADRRVISNGQ